MSDFFKNLENLIKNKNDEKSKKESNKKDKKEGNFYEKFRQDFSKEVRYDKIKDLKNKLSDDYKYMTELSKQPGKTKISALGVSIDNIIKNLPEDFKKGYNPDELKTKVQELEIKQAGFSFLTPCLIKKEYKNNFEKLIGHIEKCINKKIEFSEFSLNDYNKFSNFLKSKLKYKKDKKEIEELEGPFQNAVSASKGLIDYVEKRCNCLELSDEKEFNSILLRLEGSLEHLYKLDIIKQDVESSAITEKLKKFKDDKDAFLSFFKVENGKSVYKIDSGDSLFRKVGKVFSKDTNLNLAAMLIRQIISILRCVDDILSRAYDIIIKISNDNKIQKQNEYYKCAKQIKEIKNQIIQKINDNKINDNKMNDNKINDNKINDDIAAFIFICANLKLEYQYLIEKDKSGKNKLGKDKIDTTKFESDSVSKALSNFIDEWKNSLPKGSSLGESLDVNDVKMKFSSKTTEKYEYKSDSIPPLFSKENNDNPEISDIKQGSIGDCYLLAALQSLVGNNEGKKAIKKVFLNKKTADKDEYVKMRFFKLQFTKKDGFTCIEPSGEKTIIKINKELLINKENNKKVYNETTKSCWVDCFEKAFAVYRHDKTNVVVDNIVVDEKYKKELENLANSWNSELSLKLSSENISGGWSMIPLAAITGERYFTFKNDTDNNNTGKNEDKMYEFFEKNINDHKINTVINFKKNEIKKIKNDTGGFNYLRYLIGGKIGDRLYSAHAYSVLEVYEDEDKNKIKMIKLRNPHNDDGIDFSKALSKKKSGEIVFDASKVKKVENGMVTMRFDVFCKLVDDVEFG